MKEPEFIKTISDPNEIQNLGFDLIKSAKDEVLIIFSTANAFHRLERAGLIQLLQETTASKNNGIKVRILTPVYDQLIQKKSKANKKIDIRFLEKTSWQSNVTTLTVDGRFSLEVDLKDDSLEAIGLATYSNSSSIIWTHISIFETLWTQSEFRRDRAKN
jgi:sugar-specific transcriptional regulator TrmB